MPIPYNPEEEVLRSAPPSKSWPCSEAVRKPKILESPPTSTEEKDELIRLNKIVGDLKKKWEKPSEEAPKLPAFGKKKVLADGIHQVRLTSERIEELVKKMADDLQGALRTIHGEIKQTRAAVEDGSRIQILEKRIHDFEQSRARSDAALIEMGDENELHKALATKYGEILGRLKDFNTLGTILEVLKVCITEDKRPGSEEIMILTEKIGFLDKIIKEI